MTKPDRTLVCAQEKKLQQMCRLYALSTLRLPSFWPPEGYNPRTPFCRQRRAATQREEHRRFRKVLRDRQTASDVKLEKSVDNERDIVEK